MPASMVSPAARVARDDRHIERGVRAVVYTVTTGGHDIDMPNEAWMQKHKEAPSSWEPMPQEEYRAKMARHGIDYIFFCDEPSCSKLRKNRPANATIFRFIPLDRKIVRNTTSCSRVSCIVALARNRSQ